MIKPLRTPTGWQIAIGAFLLLQTWINAGRLAAEEPTDDPYRSLGRLTGLVLMTLIGVGFIVLGVRKKKAKKG